MYIVQVELALGKGVSINAIEAPADAVEQTWQCTKITDPVLWSRCLEAYDETAAEDIASEDIDNLIERTLSQNF